MKTNEFKKLHDFQVKARPALVALVAEARENSGNMDYAVDASMSIILIAAYGIFKSTGKEEL